MKSSKKVDPKKSGVKFFVAGGHIQSNNSKLKSVGEVNDDYLGPAFTVLFEPGDVLYVSRRTYLHKIAVPTIHGVCSNTTFVLRTKNSDNILQEFIPILMNSDEFKQFSILHSKGSVTPYINFSDIAKFEFDLPPIETQKEICSILSSKDDSVDRELINSLKNLRSSLVEKIFSDAEQNKWEWFCLEEIGIVDKTRGGSKSEDSEEGFPVIRYGDLYTRYNSIIVSINRFVQSDKCDKYSKLEYGDILFPSSGETREEIGIAAVNLTENIVYGGPDMVRFKPKKGINPVFASYALNSNMATKQKHQMAQGSIILHIYKHQISKIRLPIPPIDYQNSFEHIILKLESIIIKIEQNMEVSGQIDEILFNSYQTIR